MKGDSDRRRGSHRDGEIGRYYDLNRSEVEHETDRLIHAQDLAARCRATTAMEALGRDRSQLITTGVAHSNEAAVAHAQLNVAS
jgi:hypothetical protein